ncbi:thiamine biosynthesis protein ThiC [Methanocorpusculum labreanum Z]|uniref:Phosphomethylpyrimidine synthase n=1 Tax=Methanocorpusculum labreanum (strain ATCC 43576 / DSM 4855 / Z) TaxID=410358 RepID=A2SPX0_METLZ|nr:phosphomethylpyrimidine synthase ThiC [Methanocorpusculum labreanum]ABN06376.1 thiamine biosynthesis protein ThiC [Methanocorpusculum labreanum Z]
MHSIIQNCLHGDLSDICEAAKSEGMTPEALSRNIIAGRTILLKNEAREYKPCVIGEGATVKINVNIGTSGVTCDPAKEMVKAKAAIQNGADAIMDLSTGGDLAAIRKEILKLGIPVGTVPIYEAVRRAGNVVDLTADILFSVILDQAKQGVDFMTLHCGVNLDVLDALTLDPRVMGVVSRGGSFHTAMMLSSGEENPLYKEYDYLLEILDEYEISLSLGDGMRPGAYVDSSKLAKSQEYLTLGKLARRAKDKGVQRMIEGPGHMDYNEISYNVKMIKEITDFAPLYLLGPLVTDIAPGYDHITGAIGGAAAACAGADFLCMVSPSEHLALPNVDDIIEGTRVCKVAAHVGDLSRRRDVELPRQAKMAEARKNLDWQAQYDLSLFGGHAKEIHDRDGECETCSMCGDLCAIKIVEKALEKKI